MGEVGNISVFLSRTGRVEYVIEGVGAASFSTVLVDEVAPRAIPPTVLHGTKRLSSQLVNALHGRVALLDEIAGLADTRAELRRAVQSLGGHDDGGRPSVVGTASRDARHQLDATLKRIDELDRRFKELKRNANEAAK